VDREADDLAATPLSVSRDRHQADLQALVLSAEGIANRVLASPDGFALIVAQADHERAVRLLEIWIQENRQRPDPPEAKIPQFAHPVEIAIACAIAISLMVFYVASEGTPRAALHLECCSANARRIMSGDWWRVVTALCLHRDIVHVVGNTVIGGFFLIALTQRVGPGVAILAALASGALGNLANAVYYGARHDSIGASTAVFGIVGLLSGLEAWRRHRLALPWRGPWVPIGSGVALLAMLGAGGGRTDFGAHLFGMLAGLALGLAAAPSIRTQRPGPLVQGIAFALTLGVLAVSWFRGLS
jgi:rhomboid protease GluP